MLAVGGEVGQAGPVHGGSCLVVLTSQDVSALRERISCSRRSSSSQLDCTTSAAWSEVSPCVRATCHSSGVSSRMIS